MIETARARAVDILLDRRFLPLDGERCGTFVRIPDEPPAAGSKRRSLLQRTPAWEM